jgi:hypothetical protein
MIIVKLKCGMGNQLFQYAIGRSLSLRHQVCLKFDVSHYDHFRLRDFELDYFSIPSLDTDISMHTEEPFFHYQEPYFHYDHNFEEVPPSAYVTGFWQSEKYFKGIKAQLLEELKIKQQFTARLQTKACEIREQESVAVHIRRGDYLSEKNLPVFGVLPVEYYQKAISVLLQKNIHPTLYFFSDDIAWVRAHLRVGFPHQFISNEITKNSIEDFYLMTRCRHHIIANSSFSWWAAWLNEYEHKIVIAPRKWFNNAPHNTNDLIPREWIKI